MNRNWMLKLVRGQLPPKPICVEFGVHFGNFSQVILNHLNPKRLYLVDRWLYDPDHPSPIYGRKNRKLAEITDVEAQARWDEIATTVMRRYKSDPRVTIYRADSLNVIPDNHVDFAYLDADHSYNGTIDALNEAYRCVKVGGIIAGDDYRNNGWWENQVIKAVNEFIKAYMDIEIIEIHQNQFVLRKLKSVLE